MSHADEGKTSLSKKNSIEAVESRLDHLFRCMWRLQYTFYTTGGSRIGQGQLLSSIAGHMPEASTAVERLSRTCHSRKEVGLCISCHWTDIKSRHWSRTTPDG